MDRLTARDVARAAAVRWHPAREGRATLSGTLATPRAAMMIFCGSDVRHRDAAVRLLWTMEPCGRLAHGPMDGTLVAAQKVVR